MISFFVAEILEFKDMLLISGETAFMAQQIILFFGDKGHGTYMRLKCLIINRFSNFNILQKAWKEPFLNILLLRAISLVIIDRYRERKFQNEFTPTHKILLYFTIVKSLSNPCFLTNLWQRYDKPSLSVNVCRGTKKQITDLSLTNEKKSYL